MRWSSWENKYINEKNRALELILLNYSFVKKKDYLYINDHSMKISSSLSIEMSTNKTRINIIFEDMEYNSITYGTFKFAYDLEHDVISDVFYYGKKVNWLDSIIGVDLFDQLFDHNVIILNMDYENSGLISLRRSWTIKQILNNE